MGEAEGTRVDHECPVPPTGQQILLVISCFLEMQCHSANATDATDLQDLVDSFAYTLPDVFKHGEHFWVPVCVDNRTSGLVKVPSIKE